ncbi:Basic amino-acid permease [Orbilia ellipsospora]|uniref:Cuticle-degrading serine protease n=1 Tax=Orbilia ellipsospora TaxID=2528407 RepID=A0AAV9XNI6_9PEZI
MMFGKSIGFLFALVGFVFAVPLTSREIHNLNARDTIPDKYIVVFKDGTSDASIASHITDIKSFHTRSVRNISKRAATAGVEKTFSMTGFKAYSGGFDSATVHQIIQSPHIKYVEADHIVTTSTVQSGAEWGLDRISHRNFSQNPLNSYRYAYDGAIAGEGVTVYVIDTGVKITHQEFEGRARSGYNFVGTPDIVGAGTDEVGHGTHCAGLIGGKTYGVAKRVNLVAVKVLGANGSGSTSTVIQGMQWTVTNGVPGKSIINMSLGGLRGKAFSEAAISVRSDGFLTVLAAGNEGRPDAFDSPASSSHLITVGALNIQNKIAYFSNWGPRVDLYAPGVDIKSAWINDITQTKVLSGTSMAASYVAGLAAYLIGGAGPLTPDQVIATITNGATTGQIVGREIGDPALTGITLGTLPISPLGGATIGPNGGLFPALTVKDPLTGKNVNILDPVLTLGIKDKIAYNLFGA